MKTIPPKRKGLLKEKVVASHLKQKGWSILYQNKKILGVEIDILAKKGKEVFLIEVKSIKKEEHLQNILKDKQKERLKKAAESLVSEFPDGLSLLLAAVDHKNKVEFFEIF